MDHFSEIVMASFSPVASFSPTRKWTEVKVPNGLQPGDTFEVLPPAMMVKLLEPHGTMSCWDNDRLLSDYLATLFGSLQCFGVKDAEN